MSINTNNMEGTAAEAEHEITPNTTLVVDTPQKVTKRNFNMDTAQLTVELSVLSINTDKVKKGRFIKSIGFRM